MSASMQAEAKSAQRAGDAFERPGAGNVGDGDGERHAAFQSA